jgi:predicted TIM-barrel fold metal-dependent hydrolase
MTIDFHTHIFPDELAPKALAKLSEAINHIYAKAHDGTLTGLLARMDEWGVDVSVVQPVVTRPSQVKSVNEWAAGINSERIISFGGIYPLSEDYRDAIDFVASLGLKGLKFHAEYQDFILDDPHMLRVYDYALSKGLILLHHAGFDPGFKPPFKSSPRQFRNVADELRGGVIIAAHLGGHAQWDDVEEFLCGSGIYLDTAMGFEFYSREQFLRIVIKHGADKILFASDSPWSSAKTELEHLKSLPLTEEERAAIIGGNAQRLLSII